jgi:hypothetical protein
MLLALNGSYGFQRGGEVSDKEAFWLGHHMERFVNHTRKHGELLEFPLAVEVYTTFFRQGNPADWQLDQLKQALVLFGRGTERWRRVGGRRTEGRWAEGRRAGGPESRRAGGSEGRKDGGSEGRKDGGPEGRKDGGPVGRTTGRATSPSSRCALRRPWGSAFGDGFAPSRPGFFSGERASEGLKRRCCGPVFCGWQ